MNLKSINPSTGKIIKSHKIHSMEDIKCILGNTLKAQVKWADTNLNYRLDYINSVKSILLDQKHELSIIITKEMGKPINQSISEIEKCGLLCDYYLKNSSKFLKDYTINTESRKSYISTQPLGVILGIMPWNFPFWQVFRFAIPNLIIGNGIILKHASNVQICANKIEFCFNQSGFIKNIFQNLIIPGKDVNKIIKDSSIAGITITGSELAGKSVAKAAGSVMKKAVLELGGSDPYIILDDANLEKSIQCVIDGRMINAGQSCIGPKRVIVTKNIYPEFMLKLQTKLKMKTQGDPMNQNDIGPLVSYDARKKIQDQIKNSINLGAKLILGGIVPIGNGAYYPITILDNVTSGMPVFDEEVFGPVFCITKAENAEQAIEFANDTKFGLGASIFTKNIKYGEKVAKTRLNAGVCFVNDFIKSDPRLPFGGIKASGYGRELSGFGLIEFANIKTVVIND